MATKVPWPLLQVTRPEMGWSRSRRPDPAALQLRSGVCGVKPSWVYRVNPSLFTEIDEPGGYARRSERAKCRNDARPKPTRVSAAIARMHGTTNQTRDGPALRGFPIIRR